MVLSIEALRKVPFFSVFKDENDLKEFVTAGHWAKHANAAVVYRVGDPANKIYILASGKIRLSRGKSALITLGPGQIFGEVGPLLGVDRTVNAVSVGDSITFECHLAALNKVPLETRYDLLMYLYETTTRRFVETTRKISSAG